MTKEKETSIKLTYVEASMLLQSVNESAYQGKYSEAVVKIKEKLQAAMPEGDT